MLHIPEELLVYALNRLGRGEDRDVGEVLRAALVVLRQEIRLQEFLRKKSGEAA